MVLAFFCVIHRPFFDINLDSMRQLTLGWDLDLNHRFCDPEKFPFSIKLNYIMFVMMACNYQTDQK